ncbi:MAG: hypothetical protein K8I01_13100 [Candidatus Methylomirabilis sp.]|nr:hypothetical protein [Deltaproteobacteria bacterium]
MVTEMNPIEHFKELVSGAMKRQKVKAGELAEFYLSSLLTSFLTVERIPDEPLAVTYLKALGATREVQFRQMKQLGDVSLFTSGFFSDSLKRKIVDIDYYMAMGSASYGFLANMHRGGRNEEVSKLFGELASKFAAFADVLTEVSERSRLTSPVDILRIYERWLRTRSRLAEKVLREMGIEPQDASTKSIH